MTGTEETDCRVSFIIPARNEEAFLPATLRSIQNLATDITYEIIVVDGDSEDETAAIAHRFGVRINHEPGQGRGRARDIGAHVANGDWLAFIDADTVVCSNYLDAMFDFVSTRDLAAATSRCRLVGCRRAKVMEFTINHLFPRLNPPILPGFNFFIDRNVYLATGGFPDVPNEDTAFSRKLGRTESTDYHPSVLVETSARRIEHLGLTRTLYYYSRLDWGRYQAEY